MLSAGAIGNRDKMSDMLDLSFMTEWSDDEGIGSDVSLENSEKSSSSGTLTASETVRRQSQLANPPKRSISVKRIVKILRRSVGTAEAEMEGTGVAPVSDCQFQRGKVFGVDLTEHLEQTSCLVPHILEFCCDMIEESGVTDGVYRLSGQSSHIVTLKREFEGGKVPGGVYKNDVHAVASLLKVSLPHYAKLDYPNKNLFYVGLTCDNQSEGADNNCTSTVILRCLLSPSQVTNYIATDINI